MGIEWPVRLDSIDRYRLTQHGGFRFLELEELQVLDRYAAEILNEIEDQWPVDTSTSRDSFSYTLLSDGTTGFTIQNDCDYVEYITEAGTTPVRDGGAPLYETLIPQIVSGGNPTVTAMLDAMRTVTDSVEARLSSAPAAAARPRRPRGNR
jgi:hypothetical protein